MAYSKRQYEDISDAQLDQAKDNKYGAYLDEQEIEMVAPNEDGFYQEQYTLFQDIIIGLAERIEDGEALEIKGVVKKMSKLITEINDELHDNVSMLCEQHSPKNTPFSYAGYEFHRTNGRKMYEWKTLTDIDFHLQQIEKIKKSYKVAEMVHRFGDKPEYTNPENGDVFQPIPIKYSKDVIKVKELK